MRRRSSQRFNLGDLMALVVVPAVGTALARWVEAPLEPALHEGLKSWGATGAVANYPWAIWLGTPSCHVATLTAVLVALRWYRPGRRPWRILREPGAVACLATLAAMAVGLALGLVEHAAQSVPPNGGPRFLLNCERWRLAVDGIPSAVAGTWAAMALGRRWSPRRTWIDRLGRAVGVFWLAWIPTRWAGPILSTLLPNLFSER